MMALPKIPKALKNKLFSVKDAEKAGLAWKDLQTLTRHEKVQRVAKNVYKVASDDVPVGDLFAAATLRVGEPSAICLVSALYYHGLTTEFHHQTWVMVPETRRTQHKDIVLLRRRNPHWEIGIFKEKQFWVTSVERSLVECLAYKNKVATGVAVEALNEAIASTKTNFGRVAQMAKALGLERILEKLELLAAT